MLAFHSDLNVKNKYLTRVRKHRAADQLIKGTYWERGDDDTWRGCSVGCTIHSNDHSKYEAELGIPQILARLKDSIFESLPEPLHLDWPERFLIAIRVGSDLSLVWPKFAVWLLNDPQDGIIRFTKTDPQHKIIQDIADLYLRKIEGQEPTVQDWRLVRSAAAAAAADAADAAADRSQARIRQADKLIELLQAA